MPVSEEVKHEGGAVGKRVAKATGAILLGQLAAKFLGAVEKPLMAFRFGTGPAADAYGAAVGLVLNITYIVEQLLQHAFMPTFIQTRAKEGEKQGWRLASTVVNLVLILFVAAGALSFFFAPQIVAFATDFKNPRTTRITESLLRIMVPAIIILPVSSFTYVVLNSYKVFGLPAAADVFFKGGTVLALVLLAERVGVPALAIGVVLGTLAKILIHLVGLRAQLPHYRPTVELKSPTVRTVGILAVPLLLGNVMGNLRPLWDNWLASGLELGAVAALRYGRALVDTPAQIFPLALRRALFPFMSEMAARDDRERMTEIVVRSLRVVAFVFLPMTVGMLLLRYPIVQTVYQWGKFGKDSTELVVPAMTFLTYGLLAMGAEMILLEPYFAMSDTLTPTKIAVVTFIAHLGFTWGGSVGLGMGVGGVALGYTLARTLKVIILAIGLRKRLAPVDWRPVIDFTLRLSVAVAVMGMVVAAAIRYPVMPRSLLLLERTQLRDKGRLLVSLPNPDDPRAPLSQHLLSRFSPETREMLGEYYASIDPPAALKIALADDLNRVLRGEALYEEARFAEVNLSDQTWEQIAARPTGAALLRLNRVLLEEAYPNRFAPVGQRDDTLTERLLFRPADLDHKARFVDALRQGEDPLSRHLRSQLSPETRALLEAYPAAFEPSRAVREAVVRDLNQIIQGECLYSEERFAAVPLSGETRKLVTREPRGTVGVWLNRMLLEEAYRDEIAPPQKWVDLIRLSVPSAVGALVFALLCLALRVEEATYLFGFILKRLRRK